jgi:phage putative head morphogenesis protein, SPP1 gp7 family
MLADTPVAELLKATSEVLSEPLHTLGVSHQIPQDLTTALEENTFYFSGFKTHHELLQASQLLKGEDGGFKPFNQFMQDVQKIDNTYNRNYLQAEYNFAVQSTQMAVKWKEWERDGDDYDLQYRTAGDDRVREEHAALDGTTLPPSDPFWNHYLPPNGWNCRCTVVQVLKDKYRATDHAEAMRRGGEALAKDKKGMFAFNPGKQGKTFPDYNPYTISKCRTCTRKLNLAKGIPENQLCEGCIFLRTEVCGYEEVPVKRGRVRQHKTQSPDEWDENRGIATYMAEKHGYEIDLLPKIDDKPGQKNPDSLNRTLGYNQEYKDNTENTYNSYDRAIRDGRKQASSLVIRLQDDADFDLLTKAMHNRCVFAKTNPVSDITIIWDNKDHTYLVQDIIEDGFKARKEDLK